jgi:hypothetical protein
MNLAKWGMDEQKGVLIQDLKNGKAMQVRLDPDHVTVRTRSVPVQKMDDVDNEKPEWTSAMGFILAEWIQSNSAVWQWLKEKGIDENAAKLRLAKQK